MKNLTLLALAAIALPLAATTPLSRWYASEAVSMPKPLIVDSTDVKGKGFDKAALLSGARNMAVSRAALISADTLSLPITKAAEGLSLQTFTTTISAERFAKGELQVTSPLLYLVKADGKKLGDRTDASAPSSQKFPLTLSPEKTVDLQVVILTDATDTLPAEFKMAWVPASGFEQVQVKTDPSQKRRFTLDDTMFGPRVTDASLSADGRWLLTRFSDMSDLDNTLKWAVITDLNSGREQRIAHKPGMAWMPKSAKLYYTDKGEQGVDLCILNPADMSVEVIATDVPDESMAWNPAETLLYYVAAEKPEAQTDPVKRVTSPAERIPGSDARSNLHEFNPATGIDRPLTFGHSQLSLQDFHPSQPKLLLTSFEETPTRRPYGDIAAYELDLLTLALDTIVAPTGMLSGIAYSPDGSKFAISAAPDFAGGLGKNYGNHPVGNDYDHQLFILDRKGNLSCVSKDFTPALDSDPVWSKTDGRIYFTVTEGFDAPVYSYSPADGKFRRMPMPEGVTTIRRWDLPVASSRLAYTAQGPETAGAAYIYDLKSSKSRTQADPLAARLAGIDMAEQQQWNFTASDGTEIEGYCVLPPDFDPTKKYPLIVYYYGGTLPTQHGISSPYSPQVFASRDYVVYVLNPSGTTGYGQEFSARHCNAWGKRTAEDIIEGTQAFVKAHPFVNAEKIGCLGASYGGFMTQYLQTLTPMFAAAVSHAGISNVTSYWGEGYWGYSYNAVAAPDSYPWSNPELFTRQGSLFNADKINTPLLLLHGTADTNVPVGESIQLYNALKILGKQVELVTVDGENHFISDYAKRRRWQDTIMAWFARYLQDDPSWWNALYPAK